MGNVKMGFEGQIFWGTAGATGTNQLTNATDIGSKIGTKKASTMPRGVGTTAPIETQSVTSVELAFDFTMLLDITDSNLSSLMAAAASVTPVAMRLKDYAAGKGFDGDCYLDVDQGMPINGEQTKKFTATPTRDAGRAPQAYV